MQAELVQVRCQHLQEYGEQYTALAVIQSDGSKFLLRLPMWQYDHEKSPMLLQRIVDAVNGAV